MKFEKFVENFQNSTTNIIVETLSNKLPCEGTNFYVQCAIFKRNRKNQPTASYI